MHFRLAFAFTILLTPTQQSPAAEPPKYEFLDFIRTQAAALRASDKPPATRAEWDSRRKDLRARLLEAWGGFPTDACPLEPKKLGELKREGYTVEKLIFQTLPGVWMTANAYVPHSPGKHAAILQVHGHWKGAKQDPVVQSRCIGAAKLGFFVLVVDAFGAGERGVGEALGEYHGEMTAATLLPTGRPLSGIQVYENLRAVDYLRTRPEVDGERIGITGASGGGNQTMYAGGWDDRHKCVVPVCSVGNYQAYLGAACCMCEVVPGALTFTEEGDVLSFAAPRGLMVVSATKDAPQFSVAEAKKSVARADSIFTLFDKTPNVRHAIFESPHAYNQAMREAMYGWMTKHLKGEGDGSPIPEPAFKTEDPEELRCFPGTTRPKDFVTIPRFAAAEAKKVLGAKPLPANADDLRANLDTRRDALVAKVLGGFPTVKPKMGAFKKKNHGFSTSIEPEPGLKLDLLSEIDANAPALEDPPFVLILSLEGPESPERVKLKKAAFESGWVTLDLELRATGKLAYDRDKVGRAPDHTTAEWSMWIGRPLLGQWVFDVRQTLNALEAAGTLPKNFIVIGEGSAGLVALAAAATDPRIKKVATFGTLASYVSDTPYAGQRLGTLAPGILRDVGDVAHLAALTLPRKVVIAGGVSGDGKALSLRELEGAYDATLRIAGTLQARQHFELLDGTSAEAVIKALK